jgi:cyanate permease
MRNENEIRIVVVWLTIGILVGLIFTPASSATMAQAIYSGVGGAAFGYLLVLRLRWMRRR